MIICGAEFCGCVPAAGAGALQLRALRRGLGLCNCVPCAGGWVSAPNLLKNFLPVSKSVELTANEARFWPISRIKACCSVGKRELAWDYFEIDPRQLI